MLVTIVQFAYNIPGLNNVYIYLFFDIVFHRYSSKWVKNLKKKINFHTRNLLLYQSDKKVKTPKSTPAVHSWT